MKSEIMVGILIGLYITAVAPYIGAAFTLKDMAPVRGTLESLGIHVDKVVKGTNPVGMPIIRIDGTYIGKKGLTVRVRVAVVEYASEESARKVYTSTVNQYWFTCPSPEKEDTVLYSKAARGDASSYCYGFSTSLTLNEDNGKYYRSNPSFSYEKDAVSGRYVVSIILRGSWSDNYYNNGNYTTTVVIRHNGSVEAHTDVDEARYGAYLDLLGKLRSETEGMSQDWGNRLSSAVVSSLGGSSETLSLSSSTSSRPSYSVSISSPRDGVTLKQLFSGYFVVSLRASVRGDGARGLYAVVTLPDGSSGRLPVYDGEILGVLHMTNPTVKDGTLAVSLYGNVNGENKLLAERNVHLNLVSAEVPGDGIDNDMDGLVDCDDPDIATCDACILQKKLEWAESLMDRHVDYINRMIETDPGMKSVYDLYIEHLRELHEQYKDDPEGMVKEMNAYMEEKVYRNQEVNRYISIFKDDPEKRYQLRQIAEKYRYDPIMRRIKMRRFIYENSQSEAEREATMNAILTGILEPPKWLVGGQYGSGGALDWANFVAGNFETVGDTVKLKGTQTVKILRTPANVFLVAQDARSLMKQAEELKNMNLPENTKVSIIVLDGATKIGKLLDPTGYFGNMADATIGALVNLRKKIEERNQGWFTWNGYVLHETAKPGIYEDYETGKKFRRVSGGWLSKPVFVEVKENG